jgi:hypothetical protein
VVPFARHQNSIPARLAILPDVKLKTRERKMRSFTSYDSQCGAFPSHFSPRQRHRRSWQIFGRLSRPHRNRGNSRYSTLYPHWLPPRGSYRIKYSTLAYWLQSRRRHRQREKLLIKAGADAEPGKSNGGWIEAVVENASGPRVPGGALRINFAEAPTVRSAYPSDEIHVLIRRSINY